MITHCHRREADEKAIFDEELMEWFNLVRQFISAESTCVSTPGVVSLTFHIGLCLSFQTRFHAEHHLSFHGRFNPRPLSMFLAGLHLTYKARLCLLPK